MPDHLTPAAEALLAEVHGTQMALTVFPARLAAIQSEARATADAEVARLREAAQGIIDGYLATGSDPRWLDRLNAGGAVTVPLSSLATLRAALATPAAPVAQKCGHANVIEMRGHPATDESGNVLAPGPLFGYLCYECGGSPR